MKDLVLYSGIALLLAALYFHAIAQANVITKIDRAWFERLFTGSRASRDNLNKEGRQSRNRSDLCAIGGFLLIGIYVFVVST